MEKYCHTDDIINAKLLGYNKTNLSYSYII